MKTLLLVLTFLLFSACSSLQVQTDYDPNVDLKSLKSYTLVHKQQEREDTLTSERIQAAIHATLETKGYVKTAQKSADFLVVYHIDVKNKTRVDTNYQQIGLYPYRFGGGMMIATTESYDYEEGRLIIDIMDPESQKIVWRGMGIDYLKSFDNPQERIDYINSAVAKILASFPEK